MSESSDTTIEELFYQALELPAGQRAAFVRERCDDADVCAKVEMLLRHDDEADGEFLVGPIGATPPDISNVHQATAPRRIGPYDLLSVIGEGGMGVVYEAQEDHPRRRVALKLIRPGFTTRAMLRRFRYEADVLARLEHPGIARVYQAGITNVGSGPQPFFAMELVQGTRLDKWIKVHNPSQRQRLELFIAICQAVQHAHTKGVIHRDLKPANILVTDDGQPKILDFGVARATDSDIQSTTLHTETGQIVGTLPYMAPEQAAGNVNELDTTSDVYALGVIAYELLSGKMPYALEGKPLHEAVRVICEDEPSRLSSIDRSLRGDVETIVGKALEKDKTRRYHTAGEFAADVKRYLDYEPITARPPGTWYQVTRFAKRNKLLVSAAAILLLVMSSATIISTWQAVRATTEKRRADEQAAIAEAVNDFFNKDILGQASPRNQARPGTDSNPDLKVREALDRAAELIDDRFDERPLVEAAIRDSIGNAYDDLGEPAKAEQHLREAIRLNREHAGADDPRTLTSEYNLALLYVRLGRFSEAEAQFKHVLETRRRVLGHDHENTLETLAELGAMYVQQDRFSEAEPLLTEAFETQVRIHGEHYESTLVTMNDLAHLYFNQGLYDKAEPLYLRALVGMRKTKGDQHPNTLANVGNLGVLYAQQRQYSKAEPYLLEVLETSSKVHGERHRDTFYAMEELGVCYMMQQRRRTEGKPDYAQAQALLEQSFQGLREMLGHEHPETLLAAQRLAMVYLFQDDYAKAKPLVLETLEAQRRTLGELHQSTLNTMNDLARVYEVERDFDKAEAMYLKSWEGKKLARGPRQQSTLVTLGNLCRVYLNREKYSEAEPLLLEGLETARGGGPDIEAEQRNFQSMLGELHYRRGQYDKAEPLLAELCTLIPERPVTPVDAATYFSFYGIALAKMGRSSEAHPCLIEAVRRLNIAQKQKHPRMREVVAALADLCDATDRPDEAAKWRAELAALQAATQPTTQAAAVSQ